MSKQKDLRDLEKAIRRTSIFIESETNDEGVHITVGGSRVGVIYKMAHVLAELVSMEALHFEDIEYIAQTAEDALKERHPEDLEPVDIEELSPREQAITKAIEQALKSQGLTQHLKIIPMAKKEEKRRKKRGW